jgi:hypothetical protein
VNAISESGRVFLETILDTSTNGQTIDEEMFARQAPLFDRHGAITKIEGDWKGIVPFRGMQTNLAAFNSAAAGYGSANVIPDEDDKIVRRQPLVQKYALLIDELPLEALQPGMTVDTASFQRLSWQDSNGVDHHIELPLTERSLPELASKMKKSPRLSCTTGRRWHPRGRNLRRPGVSGLLHAFYRPRPRGALLRRRDRRHTRPRRPGYFDTARVGRRRVDPHRRPVHHAD